MKIVIYTITDCPFSKAEKEYLASKNLSFEEKNIETDRKLLDEMLSLSDGFAGVPFTIITKDDGKELKMKGFTKEDFEKELAQPAAVDTMEVKPATPAIGMTVPVSIPPTVAPVATPVPSQPVIPVADIPSSPTNSPTQPNDLSNVLNTLSSMSTPTGQSTNPVPPPIALDQSGQIVSSAPSATIPSMLQPVTPVTTDPLGSVSATGASTTATAPSIPDFPQS